MKIDIPKRRVKRASRRPGAQHFLSMSIFMVVPVDLQIPLPRYVLCMYVYLFVRMHACLYEFFFVCLTIQHEFSFSVSYFLEFKLMCFEFSIWFSCGMYF